MSRIVSVQDISCVGQCSLTVALPILSAKGIECSILPSGILSTHTGGFSGFSFLDLTDEMTKIIEHWEKEKLTFDAIYTGYIGDVRQFDIIRDLRKLLNPGGKLYVDPAMADQGKLYLALSEDIVDGMRGIIAEADMIMPNLTEACFLIGREYKEEFSKSEIRDLIESLSKLGPSTVILTGVSYEEGKIGAVAFDRTTNEWTEYFADKVTQSYPGTGDIFSSILVADLINGLSLYDTLKDACEFIVKSIKNTLDDPNHPYGVKFEKTLAMDRTI